MYLLWTVSTYMHGLMPRFATASPTLSKNDKLCKSAPRIVFSARDLSGQPRAGKSSHLTRSDSQSEHRICPQVSLAI